MTRCQDEALVLGETRASAARAYIVQPDRWKYIKCTLSTPSDSEYEGSDLGCRKLQIGVLIYTVGVTEQGIGPIMTNTCLYFRYRAGYHGCVAAETACATKKADGWAGNLQQGNEIRVIHKHPPSPQLINNQPFRFAKNPTLPVPTISP
jgi:hypothetical protein